MKKTKEPTKPKGEALRDEALERYKICTDAWGDNKKNALEDIRFAALEQWPDDVKKARNPPGKPARPCLVVDKTAQYRQRVVNEARQNRPSVNVFPVDSGGDIKVADAYKGLIRQICSQPEAQEALDTAVGSAVTGGYGYLRVTTDYVDDSGFEQEIKVRRIRNPLAVMLDPSAQCADGSDAEFGFVVDQIPRSEFKSKYPDAEKVNWDGGDEREYAEGWLDKLTVRVCEYWYKVYESVTMHLLSDGTAVSDEEYQKTAKEFAESGGQVPNIVRSRKASVPKVKFCRISGAEILEQKDWAGIYIPIIPVYGVETDIDGKVSYSGLIRQMRDPCMLYNYSRSAFAERVALAPKSPWVIAAGQVEGYENIWATANTENHAYLPYNPADVNGDKLPAPQRVQAADVPAGFAADMEISEHDIEASVGMFAAALGAPSNETSGKAIRERRMGSDIATFHYLDNLSRAVTHLGRILVNLIPPIMDTKRVARWLGEDGKIKMIGIDPNLEQPSQKLEGMEVFNLGAGRYDVGVSSGPNYATRRQESAEAMVEAGRANPAFWQTHADLIVANQDWPNAEEFAKRSKLLMPPEIKALIDEDEDNAQVKAVMAQAQQALAEKDAMLEQAAQAMQQAQQQTQKLESELQEARNNSAIEAARAETEHYRAETERMKAEADANRVEPVAPDTSEMEALKLQYEDKWKKLEAEAEVIVAAINQQGQVQSAAHAANASQEAEEPVIAPPQVDTGAALATAIEGFTAALAELRRPRVATMSDGRQISIQ